MIVSIFTHTRTSLPGVSFGCLKNDFMLIGNMIVLLMEGLNLSYISL